MVLDARRVAELQHFLMDGAKRFGAAPAPGDLSEDVLASAAALDYVLLIASQHAGELRDDGAATAAAVRETLTRAAGAALDIVVVALALPQPAFDEFVERHVRQTCVFAIVRDFVSEGAVVKNDVAFRTLTLASEVLERRVRTR